MTSSNHNTPKPFTGFADLEDDFRKDTLPDTREEIHYSCPACNGTGRWHAPMGGRQGECFTCNGRGYFKTSPEQRARQAKDRETRRHNKHRVAVAQLKAFKETHKDLYAFLINARDWNDFAASLCAQIGDHRPLSEKQIAAAERMMAKVAANRKAREAAKAAAPVIDLTKIMELVNTALESGYRTPRLRIHQLVISRAPDNGRNAGHLYVKRDGEYAGKITPEGKWLPVNRNDSSDTLELLQSLAADPRKALTEHGKKTGECACCGRTLTNGQSIELGIGPICADRWGL